MHNFPPSPEKPPVPLSLPFLTPPHPAPSPRLVALRAGSRAGFSLVEVALAITIVAFAFVALLGLLPTGMNVFNQTIDSTNEMRISSDITSLLQATEYNKLTKPEISENIFYFDSDGGALDSEMQPIARYLENRVYAARIVIDKQNIPAAAANDFFDENKVAHKVMVVIGKQTDTNKGLMTALRSSDEVLTLPAKQKLRVLPILITKTDGQEP